MKIRTKSVLFGARAFWLHPFMVAWAWTKLYGFPFDPRLWVAFLIHDWGYLGKPNMDGPEGILHPWLGAEIMHHLFDKEVTDVLSLNSWTDTKWFNFMIGHSRSLSKRYGLKTSRLCVADKLSIALMPRRLYIAMTSWTGELKEYMDVATKTALTSTHLTSLEKLQLMSGSPDDWFCGVSSYMRRWAENNKGAPCNVRN